MNTQRRLLLISGLIGGLWTWSTWIPLSMNAPTSRFISFFDEEALSEGPSWFVDPIQSHDAAEVRKRAELLDKSARSSALLTKYISLAFPLRGSWIDGSWLHALARIFISPVQTHGGRRETEYRIDDVSLMRYLAADPAHDPHFYISWELLEKKLMSMAEEWLWLGRRFRIKMPVFEPLFRLDELESLHNDLSWISPMYASQELDLILSHPSFHAVALVLFETFKSKDYQHIYDTEAMYWTPDDWLFIKWGRSPLGWPLDAIEARLLLELKSQVGLVYSLASHFHLQLKAMAGHVLAPDGVKPLLDAFAKGDHILEKNSWLRLSRAYWDARESLGYRRSPKSISRLRRIDAAMRSQEYHRQFPIKITDPYTSLLNLLQTHTNRRLLGTAASLSRDA